MESRRRLEALKDADRYDFVWHLGDIAYADDAFLHATSFGTNSVKATFPVACKECACTSETPLQPKCWPCCSAVHPVGSIALLVKPDYAGGDALQQQHHRSAMPELRSLPKIVF